MALHYDYSNHQKLLEQLNATRAVSNSGSERTTVKLEEVDLPSSPVLRSSGPSRSRRSSGTTRGSSDNDDDWPGLETPLSERAPRGTATRERRRQQNRIAQKALRERKEAHLKDLERTNEMQQMELARLSAENETLRDSQRMLAESRPAVVPGSPLTPPVQPYTQAVPYYPAAQHDYASAFDAVLASKPLPPPYVATGSYSDSINSWRSASASSMGSEYPIMAQSAPRVESPRAMAFIGDQPVRWEDEPQ